MRLLVVEDDPILAKNLVLNFNLEGYETLHSPSLREASQVEQSHQLDLVVLDLGLPDGSGFDFLHRVRQKGSRLPIIILTAQTDEDSVVKGLELGASDYMRKPFGVRELMARVKATLRQPTVRDEQIRYADLVLLVAQRKVICGEKELELNRREFDVLLYLAERAETIVSRENLLSIWNQESDVFDRTVDSHVSHLRSKLKKADIRSIKISSVYGLGYRLEKES